MVKGKEIPESCDAVVIGAGLGGLVCGLEMQKNGLQVTIVEKRHLAGGYAHHFRRGDYCFDVALHHIGGLGEGGMTYKLLKSLDVLDRLEFEKPEIMSISEFPDTAYEIPNNPKKAVDYLGKHFPVDIDGLKKLFSYSVRLKNHVVGPVLYPDFAIPMEDMLSLRNVEENFEDLLNRFVTHPRLRAILGQLWMYLGLPPSLSSANFSNCVFASGFVEGRYNLKGGSTALVDTLTARFREEGGKLVFGKKVKHIDIRDKAVSRVVLEDESIINTEFIAANLSPPDIFPGLVDAEELSEVFLHRLEGMQPSVSAFTTYIGLDCSAENLGIPLGNTFINHGNNLEEAYRDCMESRLEQTDWCLTNSEDHGSAPDGCSGIAIVEITSEVDWLDLEKEDYRKRKAEVQDRLMSKYDARYPGLKDHAVVVEFGTPRTLRRYSGNAHGSLYGFAQIPSQANNRRLSNRTPIRGLYLCGAWTQAGGGFEGTMMTGMKTAHMILAENGKEWDTGLRYGRDSESLEDFTENHAAETNMTAPPKDFSTPDYPFYRNDYQIYPDDTDWTESAKETAFLRFMDRARVRLMEQSPKLREIRPLLDSYYVKLYSIFAHIHERVGVGETVTVQTGYKRATSHRAAVDHYISSADGRTILTGRAEIMFVSREGELVELPDIYRTQKTLPFPVPEARLPKLLFADLSNHRFESEFLVSYEDTDMQGVVYNVAYIKFAQKMFWEIRNNILPAGSDVSRVRVEHLDIRFMNAARLLETVLVKAAHRPIDESRFGIDFRMFLKETGETLADLHLEYYRY